MPLWSRRHASLPRQIDRCCSGPIVPVARPDPSRTHWPTVSSRWCRSHCGACYAFRPVSPGRFSLLADPFSWPILSPGRFFLLAESLLAHYFSWPILSPGRLLLLIDSRSWPISCRPMVPAKCQVHVFALANLLWRPVLVLTPVLTCCIDTCIDTCIDMRGDTC